ncbi:restriction endonuclease subunit S [Aeromonas veronii]|uniref:restriction endonuclease subunit S n=1 Tax=Aeromonas veronii TaxID=654 RepID=UPI003BA335A0
MAEQIMQETAGKAIPAGYQQTEVGVIPHEWNVRKLKEISPSQSVGLVINPSSYYSSNGSIPMLVGSHVSENKIFWSNANKITEESNAKLPASRLNAGDLVTVRVGAPGITAVVPIELDKANCASMMIIRKSDNFDSQWLCYLMNSKHGKTCIEGVQYGTAQKQFNIVDAVEFLFPVPPKQEQTSIANVLSDSDALIDALEQLIAKKQAIKSATMQQLLTGRTRLPAFALRPDGTPKGYKPSELGDIPEDWEVLSLGSFGRTIRGVSYNPNHDLFLYDSSESIRLFRSNNIFESKIEKSELQYVSKSRVADHQVIMVGDILICMANGSKSLVGKSAFYSIDDGYKYTFGAFMGVYRASDNVNRQYVHYLMNTEWYRRYIDLVLAGSSINNLKPSHVDQISFAFPDIKEQTAIATILSDMDNELQVLTQKLEKARALKQGMMQQLLTGKIRLPLAAGA